MTKVQDFGQINEWIGKIHESSSNIRSLSPKVQLRPSFNDAMLEKLVNGISKDMAYMAEYLQMLILYCGMYVIKICSKNLMASKTENPAIYRIALLRC